MRHRNLYGILQGFDSAFNILVLKRAGALFLSGLDSQWSRQQMLDFLHELRSIIHVIDMHQLTKDPSSGPTVSGNTTHSRPREMTDLELSRYLDYCSALLSLSAKVAALYAQGTRDAVVIETTCDLGQITSNLSGRIWLKITMIQTEMNIEKPAAAIPAPHAHISAQRRSPPPPPIRPNPLRLTRLDAVIKRKRTAFPMPLCPPVPASRHHHPLR